MLRPRDLPLAREEHPHARTGRLRRSLWADGVGGCVAGRRGGEFHFEVYGEFGVRGGYGLGESWGDEEALGDERGGQREEQMNMCIRMRVREWED